MFSHVYGSWECIQKEKFEKIFALLGEDFLQGLAGKKILDIGSGPFYLEEFLGARIDTANIVCIDPDKMVARNAVEETRRNFVIGKAGEMPFRDGVFDAAFCFDAIHLIGGDSFADPVARGGILVASVFYNDDSYAEKREMLLGKTGNFDILKEFTLGGKEKELVVVARKKS